MAKHRIKKHLYLTLTTRRRVSHYTIEVEKMFLFIKYWSPLMDAFEKEPIQFDEIEEAKKYLEIAKDHSPGTTKVEVVYETED